MRERGNRTVSTEDGESGEMDDKIERDRQIDA